MFDYLVYSVDIDECTLGGTFNQCEKPDSCVNIDGNYTCSCNPGYELEDDGRNCAGEVLRSGTVIYLSLIILCLVCSIQRFEVVLLCL